MPAGVLAEPLATPVPITFIAPARAIEAQAAVDPAGRGGAAAGDRRRLGRRRRRDLFRGRGRPPAAGVDPLAIRARRATSTAPISTSGASRPSPAGGSGCSSSSRRSPSGSASATRCTWRSTPAGSRCVRRPSGCGRAPDGSSLESLLRPPIAADRPSQGWRLAWRLAATMRDDHVAALPTGPLAQPRRPLVRRPPPRGDLFARPGPLDDAQRLLPPHRPPLRDVPPRVRIPTPRPTWPRPPRGATPSRSPGWPAIDGSGPGSTHADDPGAGAGHRLGGRRRRIVPQGLPRGPAVRRKPSRSMSSCVGPRMRTATSTEPGPEWAAALTGLIVTARQDQRRAQRRGYLVINPLGLPRRAAVLLPDAVARPPPGGTAPGRPAHR